MTKQEFYDQMGRYAKVAIVFVGEGASEVLRNPSDHISMVTGYLVIGLVTFLVLSLAGHRATRRGPTISAAILLAWPIPWIGVFLHACWTALTYFFWHMWRGD